MIGNFVFLVMVFFSWKKRLKILKAEQAAQAREAEARRARLGPDYRTGSGKPEPALPLYEPPDDYVGEHIDPELTMEEIDIALEKKNQLMA